MEGNTSCGESSSKQSQLWNSNDLHGGNDIRSIFLEPVKGLSHNSCTNEIQKVSSHQFDQENYISAYFPGKNQILQNGSKMLSMDVKDSQTQTGIHELFWNDLESWNIPPSSHGHMLEMGDTQKSNDKEIPKGLPDHSMDLSEPKAYQSSPVSHIQQTMNTDTYLTSSIGQHKTENVENFWNIQPKGYRMIQNTQPENSITQRISPDLMEKSFSFNNVGRDVSTLHSQTYGGGQTRNLWLKRPRVLDSGLQNLVEVGENPCYGAMKNGIYGIDQPGDNKKQRGYDSGAVFQENFSVESLGHRLSSENGSSATLPMATLLAQKPTKKNMCESTRTTIEQLQPVFGRQMGFSSSDFLTAVPNSPINLNQNHAQQWYETVYSGSRFKLRMDNFSNAASDQQVKISTYALGPTPEIRTSSYSASFEEVQQDPLLMGFQAPSTDDIGKEGWGNSATKSSRNSLETSQEYKSLWPGENSLFHTEVLSRIGRKEFPFSNKDFSTLSAKTIPDAPSQVFGHSVPSTESINSEKVQLEEHDTIRHNKSSHQLLSSVPILNSEKGYSLPKPHKRYKKLLEFGEEKPNTIGAAVAKHLSKDLVKAFLSLCRRNQKLPGIQCLANIWTVKTVIPFVYFLVLQNPSLGLWRRIEKIAAHLFRTYHEIYLQPDQNLNQIQLTKFLMWYTEIFHQISNPKFDFPMQNENQDMGTSARLPQGINPIARCFILLHVQKFHSSMFSFGKTRPLVAFSNSFFELWKNDDEKGFPGKNYKVNGEWIIGNHWEQASSKILESAENVTLPSDFPNTYDLGNQIVGGFPRIEKQNIYSHMYSKFFDQNHAELTSFLAMSEHLTKEAPALPCKQTEHVAGVLSHYIEKHFQEVKNQSDSQGTCFKYLPSLLRDFFEANEDP
ncbi:hypothetical protein CROQUDRAFT_136337 [Cronartium quercuum f. sp. fusiforme G11]|uniref:Uncharacterized protein n=1 Tax=Cronartium quercuum f. sp. fusiforme G11 TaxID=708437 RepID=A0A9P6T6J6_9BASI|nr:hypothetical protein CROQUDRAFT_136337 [Cronartium quercuum f. sp. fusiforme G11]